MDKIDLLLRIFKMSSVSRGTKCSYCCCYYYYYYTDLLCLNHCSWESIKEKTICTFRFIEIVVNKLNNKSIANQLKQNTLIEKHAAVCTIITYMYCRQITTFSKVQYFKVLKYIYSCFKKQM